MTILPQVQNFSVPPQEMITKDSVTVYVNQCVTVPEMLDDTDTDTFFRY